MSEKKFLYSFSNIKSSIAGEASLIDADALPLLLASGADLDAAAEHWLGDAVPKRSPGEADDDYRNRVLEFGQGGEWGFGPPDATR